ncbi:ABC transporter permease [Corynebacterium sp. c9Ua_112]|uniref:ABC transporter permease n=1 Tax=Corynebacterium macclintockiae TaxID=2913501 RepID=A0A9X3M7N7_9CORY|nr:ABC transporter permease [Corynebacterium macclintockiae]MCZ9305417.1 ABC transporter permease [Corynebacterium macclintockiae]
MLKAISSEVTKLLTLRSTWIYVILFTGSLYGPVTLYMLFSDSSQIDTDWPDLLTGGMIFLMIAIVFGASTAGGDINNHMTAHSFLTQKSRSSWLLARALVAAVFAELNFLAGAALSWLVVTIFPAGNFTGEKPLVLWGYAVAVPALAVVAVGIAALLRNRVGAISLPLVWMLVVEGLLAAGGQQISFLKTLYHLSPGNRVQDMISWVDSTNHDGMATPTSGFVVLIVWMVVMLALGLYSNKARDVK